MMVRSFPTSWVSPIAASGGEYDPERFTVGFSSRISTYNEKRVNELPRLPAIPRNYIIGISLLVSILVVFSRVSDIPFLDYDDPEYITENSQVLAGLSWKGAYWALTSISSANWHPLTWLSHMMDVELFGLNAGRHHLVGLFLHSWNALLLLLVLTRMTGGVWRSAFVAALFALHPLHVESVAWAAERKDVLSAFFWMLTMLAYLRYVKKPTTLSYLSVLLLFACGLMTKPMLVTLPFVLLLLDYWPLRRFTADISTDMASSATCASLLLPGQQFTLRKLVKEKIPFFILSAASSVATLYAQKMGGAMSTIEGIPVPYRLANAVVAYVSYLWKMFWPRKLAMIYPLSQSIPAWQVTGAVLTLAGISYFAVSERKTYPYLLVGWLWYLGTLVPVIGLVHVGRHAMADRYTYLPLIGPFVIIAWGAPKLIRGWRLPHYLLPVLATSILVVLAFCTWQQLGYWKNDIILFDHAVQVTENNYIAYINVGNALAKAGRIEEAIAHYNSGLGNRYYAADAHNNLGLLLMNQGKYDEAISHFVGALQAQKDYYKAQYNWGIAMAKKGNTDEAISHLYDALRMKPDDAVMQNALGYLLAGEGRFEEAIIHFSEALRIRPEFELSQQYLQKALLDKDRRKMGGKSLVRQGNVE